MHFRLRLRHRVFAPSPALTVLMLVLMAVFLLLGRWQWRMGDARSAQFERFRLGAERAVPLGAAPLAREPVYQRVRLTGRYDGAHQFLLDNSLQGGVDGYQVLTPLQRPGGDLVLVDRGWVAFTGNRARLPDVSLEQIGRVTVTGRVGRLPAPGLSFGRVPPAASGPWPRVTSFPTAAQLATALGHPIEPRILMLDPGEPSGYVRDWRPPGIPALENWGYAVQWWAFAAAALVIWAVLGFKRL